jgi:hypothetical protein
MGVIADVPIGESKQAVIEWYCTTKTEDVVTEIERFHKSDEFQMCMQFQKIAHENPEGLRKAIEAVEAGWRPNE